MSMGNSCGSSSSAADAPAVATAATASATAPFCAGCVKKGDLAPSAGIGEERIIAGADVYCVGSSDKAIVISTDIFSWRFANNRAITDQFAAAGYAVFMPRIINAGDEPDGATFDYAAWSKDAMAWLGRNPPERCVATIAAVISEVAKTHARICVFGFCYGSKPATEAMKSGHAQAAVIYHPTFIAAEDAPQLKGKGAILFQCAETDQRFTPELRAEFQRVLADDKRVHFHVYKGTTHGWSVRPTGEVEIAAAKQAHADTIEWLKTNF